jgi:hypothetical protein
MTETELIERLREAIVLDGPDAWRSNGYLQDAQAAGLPIEVALKRASEVSQEVSNNSILFQNIQARIARLAQPSRSQFIDQDLNQIVNAARSLNLSPDFVRNKWVPAELGRIRPVKEPIVTAPIKPTPVEPPATASVPVPESKPFEDLIKPEEPALRPAPVEPVVPPTVTAPAPERPKPPVYVPPPPPVFVEPTPPLAGPPPLVRSFTATPARIRKGDAVTLEWDVENLLAVTIDDLGEGLSPKNRGWIKPTKTADYTLFDANNNPLSTVRVEVIPKDNSGLYGVLFALALLALIYWFIRNNNETPEPYRKPDRQTERSTRRKTSNDAPKRKQRVTTETEDIATDIPTGEPAPSVDPPVTTVPEKSAKSEVAAVPAPVEKASSAGSVPDEPVAKPSSPADARLGKYEEAFGTKPYDKVELGTDERGWRRARSRGRWGFINEADEWVIQPEYEAVTPFRNDKAAVFLNGQLMTINREGEQIRK